MNENLQHVQLPNRNPGEDLSPKDQLIYLAIKRHAIKDNTAYPSQKTISKESGASEPTIRKSIKTLEDLDYIIVKKDGRKNIYIFNPYKQFEVFSYDFLDNDNLSFTEKAYLVSTQQFMLEKETGMGKISYSNRELAKKINMPESTIRMCNKELIKKEILSLIDNKSVDPETGCITQTKIFDLEKFNQGIVKILLNHNDIINDHTEQINDNSNRIKQLEKTVEMLQEQLSKEQSKQIKEKEDKNKIILD